MKRITITLTIVLALIFSMTAMVHAWGLPTKSFSKNIDRALKKERWNHPDEAEEYWQVAAEKGEILLKDGTPDKAEYLLGTAAAYYHLGNYDRAIELYERLVEVQQAKGGCDPAKGFPWAYVYLGLAYAKKGDAAKTIEYWEQVPCTIGGVYTVIQEQLAALKGA